MDSEASPSEATNYVDFSHLTKKAGGLKSVVFSNTLTDLGYWTDKELFIRMKIHPTTHEHWESPLIDDNFIYKGLKFLAGEGLSDQIECYRLVTQFISTIPLTKGSKQKLYNYGNPAIAELSKVDLSNQSNAELHKRFLAIKENLGETYLNSIRGEMDTASKPSGQAVDLGATFKFPPEADKEIMTLFPVQGAVREEIAHYIGGIFLCMMRGMIKASASIKRYIVKNYNNNFTTLFQHVSKLDSIANGANIEAIAPYFSKNIVSIHNIFLRTLAIYYIASLEKNSAVTSILNFFMLTHLSGNGMSTIAALWAACKTLKISVPDLIPYLAFETVEAALEETISVLNFYYVGTPGEELSILWLWCRIVDDNFLVKTRAYEPTYDFLTILNGISESNHRTGIWLTIPMQGILEASKIEACQYGASLKEHFRISIHKVKVSKEVAQIREKMQNEQPMVPKETPLWNAPSQIMPAALPKFDPNSDDFGE